MAQADNIPEISSFDQLGFDAPAPTKDDVPEISSFDQLGIDAAPAQPAPAPAPPATDGMDASSPPQSPEITVAPSRQIKFKKTPAAAPTSEATPITPPKEDKSSLVGDLTASWYQLQQAVAGNELVASANDLKGADKPFQPPRAVGIMPTQPQRMEMAINRQRKAAEDLVSSGQKAAAIPESPAATKFANSKSFTEVWDNFFADPYAVTRSMSARSAAISLPSVVGGIIGTFAGPPGSMAGAGYGSYTSEMGSNIANNLQKFGADMNDPKSILKVWREHGDEITRISHIRAAIVGTIDGLTGAVTAKIAAMPAAKNKVVDFIAKELGGLGAEATMGAGGEATAEVAMGEGLQPGNIASEAAGELGPGLATITGQQAVEAIKHGGQGQPVGPTTVTPDEFLKQAAAAPGGGASAAAGARVEPDMPFGPGHAGPAPDPQMLWMMQQHDSQDGGLGGLNIPPDQAAQIFTNAGMTVDQVRSMSPEQVKQTLQDIMAGKGPTQAAPNAADQTAPGPEVPPAAPTEQPSSTQPAPEAAPQGKPSTADVVKMFTDAGITADDIKGMSPDQLAATMKDLIAQGAVPAGTPPPEAPATGPIPAEAPIVPPQAETPAQSSPAQPNVPDDLAAHIDANSEPAIQGEGTRAQPVKVEDAVDLAHAGAQVNTEPSPAQKEAGNYKKGHVQLHGLDVTIENPKGSERTGTGPDGKPWSVKMPADYGYVKRTEGADGEHVDVFIGPNPRSNQVFVINQKDLATGKFDEHKIIMGANTEQEATDLYHQAFSDGKGNDRIHSIEQMDASQLKGWLAQPQTKPIPVTTSQPGEKIDTQHDLTAKPHLGPMFGDPTEDHAQKAYLGAVRDGRGSTKDPLTGNWKWALREGYATESTGKGVKGRLTLTDKGKARLAELSPAPEKAAKPAPIETPPEKAHVKTEEKPNADSSGVQRPAPEIPAAKQPETAQGAPGERGPADVSDGRGPASAGNVRQPDGGNGEQSQSAEGVQPKSEGAGSDSGASGGNGSPRADKSASATAERVDQDRETRSLRNYHITPDDHIGEGGARAKITGNIEAIRTLKSIELERTEATDEQKKILVKYVGWGAFAQDVFAEHKPEYAKERAQLKELLTSDELAAARHSTLNAHYTSPQVIKGMWDALTHLGYSAGRALEPSAGVGHFIGLEPKGLAGRTDWSAVELDSLTGRILQKLYAGSDVTIDGFENFQRPKGFYDLAVSNVPFGDYKLGDKAYPPMAIHDYFFVKSLDLVRPGGLVAFITSSGTMDKQRDRARKEIDKRADFLGAIRLPGGKKGAFAGNAGTEVTTDIIFLRKRAAGEQASPLSKPWNDLKQIVTPDGPAHINEYFAANPTMMLGEMRLAGTMYRQDQPVLVGDASNIDEKILEAAKAHLPENAMLPRSTRAPNQKGEKAAPEISTLDDAEKGEVKEGAFYITKAGKINKRLMGVGTEANLSGADQDRVKALIGLRNTVNTLLKNQAEGGDNKANEKSRAELSKAYGAFVKKFGPISLTKTTVTTRQTKSGDFVTIRKMPNFNAFKSDPDAFKVLALEIYDEESGEAQKAAIFESNIIGLQTSPVVSSPADAIAVSLNQTGRVDLEVITHLLNGKSIKDTPKVLGDLVFQNPETDNYETREQYLAGDVVKKLHDAKNAAKTDGKFTRNVDALEAVQPEPLTRDDIRAPMGAAWVPVDIMQNFIEEEVGSRVGVSINPFTKSWATTTGRFDTSSQTKYGTSKMAVQKVVEGALNQTPVRVTWKDREGKTHVDEDGTREAQAKVALLRDAFTGWIWKDDHRAVELENLYNNMFNRLAPQKFDGSHLTLPGLAATIRNASGDVVPFQLNPHQKNAVWRIIQNGNALLDHVVGAGKTFTMIAAGMEEKRLGLIERPIYVVPNHMLEQFSREFLQAYPGANILVAQKDEMTRDNRRAFVAKTAAQSWDGVIITHDAFGRIGMSPEAYKQFYEDQIDEMVQAIEHARADEGKGSATVKQIEKLKKNMETKLAELTSKDRKDAGVTFEEMGIDRLYVDEAHLFKNLTFVTRHTRVKGMGQGDSQRATDMFIKIRAIEKRKPKRSAVFASGTPISNTIAEMYTMQRYLQLETLREYNVDKFDAWASTFGEIITQMQLSADGRTFRETTSFSKFTNIPELVAIYSMVADTQTADMLNLPRPKRKGGKVTIIEATPSDAEEKIIQSLIQRAEQVRGKKAEKGGDNMLRVVSEGRKVATDARLLNSSAPFNPDGKTAHALVNIHRIWKDNKFPGMAQLVFLDMGVPFAADKKPAEPAPIGDNNPPEAMAKEDIMVGDDGEETSIDDSEVFKSRFNLYQDIKDRLIAKGIPKDQIAFIHDASDDVKKAVLFNKVRNGKVRVLIGSTSKMGVGTNVQRLLVALHHIDAPWKPAEVSQRDGRGERQGNLNPEIEILRYITKRSFDSFMWQTLERKAAFIAQIQAGARGVREAEDIDSPLPEAAELKAAASGDPRIMEHAELSRSVRDLEMQAATHNRTISTAKREITNAGAEIINAQTMIDKIEKDLPKVEDLTGDKFKADLAIAPKGPVDSRKSMGEAIRAFLLEQAQMMASYKRQKFTIGTLSGFKMQVEIYKSSTGPEYRPMISGETDYYPREESGVTEEMDPTGIAQRFTNLLGGVQMALSAQTEKRTQAEKTISKLQSQATNKAFPKQEELAKQQARLKQLTEDLTPKKAPPQETPPQPQIGKFSPDESHSQGEVDKQSAPWTKALNVAAQAFGYKIVNTGLPFGAKDHWGKFHSFGTQLIDRLIPGDKLHLALDKMTVADPAVKAYIKSHMTAPWFHRVWFGHDPLANLGMIIDKFGITSLPDYFYGLLKDATSIAGIPLPGVQWLVQSGIVNDVTATNWMSLNVGEALAGGLSILNTYRLMKKAKNGQEIDHGWAMAGVVFKTVGGILSSNPVVLLSAAVDSVVMVKAKVNAIREGLKKITKGDSQPQASKVPAPPARPSPQQLAEVQAHLDRLATEILGHKVNIEVVDFMEKYPDFQAAFHELTQKITVAAGVSEDPATSAMHEFMHYMRRTGMITRPEWAFIERWAKTQKATDIRAFYGPYYQKSFKGTPAQLEAKVNEEIFADGFERVANGKPLSGDETGAVARIMRKIRDFFEAIRAFFAGKGEPSDARKVENLMKDIAAGKMAGRPHVEANASPILEVNRDETPPQPSRKMPPSNPQNPSSFVEPEDSAKAIMASNDPLLTRLADSGSALALPLRRELQDKMVDMKRIEAAIVDQTGQALNGALRVYQTETLYSGRAGERLEDLRMDVLEPMAEHMARLNLNLADLDLYLYARHAPERNAYIATINPNFPDGGSGMMDDNPNPLDPGAKQVMADLAARGMDTPAQFIADNFVDPMIAESRNVLEAGQIIDSHTKQNWQQAYKHYVPLRGDPNENEDGVLGSGKKYDTRTNVEMKALGRKSHADSPTSYVIAQAQQAIILTEKARVGRSLLRLARRFPNPNLWEVNQIVTKRYLNKQTGMVSTMVDTNIKWNADNMLAVKEGGNLFWITIHHPGLAKGMKGIDSGTLHVALRTMIGFQRYFALMRTGLDPQFFIPNFLRDAQTAGIHIAGDQGVAILKETMKNIPKAMKGTWHGERGNLTTQWAKDYREFALAGGKVGAFGLEPIDVIKGKIETNIKLMKGGTIVGPYKAGRAVYRFMMDINSAVENAVRLSLYKAMRNAGYSQDEAAFTAKEVTVNFNRSGNGSKYFTAMWVFFNAGVQGVARVGLALFKSKVVRRIAFSLFMTGVVSSLLNSLISGDSDDDGLDDYDQIPEWIRERNLILMIPGAPKGGRLQIPLPWVYNVFQYAGDNMARVARGKLKSTDAAANIMGALLQAANPIQAYSIAQTLMPTLGDPAVELFANKDWKGDPIMPEQRSNETPKPDSQLYFSSVNPVYREAARTMNSMSGGDDMRPGAVDVSPETLEYIGEFLGGGVMATFNQLGSTAGTLWRNEPVDWERVPFVRKLYGTNSSTQARTDYYTMRDAVKVTKDQLAKAVKAADRTKQVEIRKDYGADIKAAPLFAETDKLLTKMRKERNLAPTDAARRNVQEQMDKLMARTRKQYRKLMGM